MADQYKVILHTTEGKQEKPFTPAGSDIVLSELATIMKEYGAYSIEVYRGSERIAVLDMGGTQVEI